MSSYKNEILANNNDLQNILTKIDELPTPGIAINGLIEEYEIAAGENISAGDFVSWLSGDAEIGADTQLSTSNYSGLTISAVALSDNKVFIAYATDDDNVGLSGVVCTISGITFTPGMGTVLSTAAYSGGVISTVVLSKNRVFIAHSENLMNGYLWFMTVEISGLSITVISDILIGDTTRTEMSDTISAILLSNDSVFVAHCYTSNKHLYGIVASFASGIIPLSNTIFGIANAGGTGGDTIQVYVPQV